MKEYTYFTVTGIEKRVFETAEDAIKAVQTAYHIVYGYYKRVTDYTVVKNTICKNGWIKKEEVKKGVTDFAVQIYKEEIERGKERIEEHKAKIEKIKASTKYKYESNRQKAIQEEENNIKLCLRWIEDRKEKIAG